MGTTIPPLKRRAEDLTQFAGEVSRAHKLAKTDHDDLARFSKVCLSFSWTGEQMVYLAGQLLALGHGQKLIQPAAQDWKTPKQLGAKIESKARTLVADSTIPAYRDDKIGPSKLLMDMVLANPSWGFPSELKDDTYAVDVVGSLISKTLINKRNIIKAAILGSLGSDPAEGATLRQGALNIVQLVAVIFEKLKVKSTRPDLRMRGRVAVLRKLMSEKNDSKYWGDVDKKLANVRNKHPDPGAQSKFIQKYMLDPDLQTYGLVNLQSLASVPATAPVAVPIADPSTASTSTASAGENDDDD
ncbi:hypothetical protein B0H13DRAFT_2434808 [Mycena leptocephala]|nr:hypothetical protein B0H13DRAFT_2434808 [Mycena leptocephala]